MQNYSLNSIVFNSIDEYGASQRSPFETITSNPDEYVQLSNIVKSHFPKWTEDDYVCIMTRGHGFDTVVQAQVLKHRPYYVGVIGSKKKAAGVRQILKEEYGLTEEELNIVITPIGIDIDAETPAEIAVSIAGQMIQVRARLIKN